MTIELTKSQLLIRSIMSEALGVYVYNEHRLGDDWKDKSYKQVLDEIKEDFEELEKSYNIDRKYLYILKLMSKFAILGALNRLDYEKENKASLVHL